MIGIALKNERHKNKTMFLHNWEKTKFMHKNPIKIGEKMQMFKKMMCTL